jgi:hypothetical protein
MAFFYIPNGVNVGQWNPSGEGTDYEFSPTLKPLEPHRQELLITAGLTLDKARANGDGGGDHARSAAAFLTGCQPRKTNGADIKVGPSVDQLAARHLGKVTRFPSLELGCDRGAQSGNCDSGYSCAYSSNISWRSEHTPVTKEVDPRQVFERLFSFGDGQEVGEARHRRNRYNKSILDFVREDASSLQRELGQSDRRKIDEYFSSMRDVERRIAFAEKSTGEDLKGVTRPQGIPPEFQDHIRTLMDLMVLAFQGDLTRVSTFMIANAGSNRSYRFVEVPEGHHSLSHHGSDEEKLKKIARIDLFHVQQFAYLLEKMKSVGEGDGTLLDNSMIVFGSGIGDGNRHNHHDLPILLAGSGGGTIKGGRYLKYENETPLTNLYTSMLDRVGMATEEEMGDSTGRLTNLEG